MVDRSVLDLVLSSLGFPGWFRHAYFEFHSHVRLRFKLAAGLGQPLDQGWGYSSRVSFEHDVHCCFVFALVYLGTQVGVQPQLYADNLKCVSRDSEVLLGAARFTCLGLLVRSLLLVSLCL